MSESNVMEASAGIARCKSELMERGWTILPRDLLRDGPPAAPVRVAGVRLTRLGR